jgi:hypothetical protein
MKVSLSARQWCTVTHIPPDTYGLLQAVKKNS